MHASCGVLSQAVIPHCVNVLSSVCLCMVCRFEGAEEAYKIIKAGPESLASQFKASYGLVLNLLSVYSLDEARWVGRRVGSLLRRVGAGGTVGARQHPLSCSKSAGLFTCINNCCGGPYACRLLSCCAGPL